MTEQQKCCEATPWIELKRQLMDSTVPKTEREWWAKGEIEKLEISLTRCRNRLSEFGDALERIANEGGPDFDADDMADLACKTLALGEKE